jgi:hypothetical protein
MPLELGIFLGAKQYGKLVQRKKLVLIFDIEPFRFQKFISDLAGMDIHAHDGNAEVAISKARDWLVNVSRRQLPGGRKLSGVAIVVVAARPRRGSTKDRRPLPGRRL